MTVYNKLKLAILAIVASQNIYAINVDPVQIQSAPGELLYAEMNFRQSDINLPIEVSLASPEDLISMGASHQPPGHLNFFTRRNSNGTGVITITSSRPVTDRELNIIVKIKEGNAARLQHIRTALRPKTDLLQASLKQNEQPLAPVVVVSEKDIALNLPVSTRYTNAPSKPATSFVAEKPLALQNTVPPALSASSIPKTAIAAVTHEPTSSIAAQVTSPTKLNTETAVATTSHSSQQTSTVNTAPVNTPSKAINTAVTQADATPNLQAAATKVQAETKPAEVAVDPTNKNATSAQVSAPTNTENQMVSSDPLVKKYAEQQARKQAASTIAQDKPNLAAKTQAQPAAIKQSTLPQVKPTYVVQSNESLWGIASRIANEQQRPVSEVMQQIKRENEHAFIGGDANRLRKGAALNLATIHTAKTPIQASAIKSAQAPSKPAAKTKYRLNEAEMSLVAENQRDSGQVSANSNTKENRTSKELSLKVMTAREKTVKLQRNVTELELVLNQKDHRIQLLNARLAQLQQQLKAQQADKKPIN